MRRFFKLFQIIISFIFQILLCPLLLSVYLYFSGVNPLHEFETVPCPVTYNIPCTENLGIKDPKLNCREGSESLIGLSLEDGTVMPHR